MPYRVTLTDEVYRPIDGVVYFNDFTAGVVLGMQEIKASEQPFTLDESLLEKAFDLTFKAPGYYNFDTPFSSFDTDIVTSVTLQAKPSNAAEVIAGLSILAIVLLFFKKAV